MKAIVYTKFGPPEVLELREVAQPLPKDSEILIRNHAATVAVEDPGMRASPGINGLWKPNKTILGQYLAGQVKAVGKNVRRFKEGDKIYGDTGLNLGTYAEYVCMPEEGGLASMPSNMTYEQAAALPNGVLTALPFLRDKGNIEAGKRVLIYGASGAVGTAAVQLAKSYGAEVTGVCSTANLELVQALGADTVIDYVQEDFTRTGQTYDIIFDCVGKSSFSRCKGILAERGVFLTTVPMPEIVLQMLWPFGGKQVRLAATGLRSGRAKAKDLDCVKELVEAGKIRAVIDRCYPLEQTAEAHRYVAKGHKRGNVVITV